MKKHTKTYLLFLFLVFAIGCDSSPDPNLNPAVESYLKNIVSIMQTNSINRKKIDWGEFTKNVLKKAGGELKQLKMKK